MGDTTWELVLRAERGVARRANHHHSRCADDRCALKNQLSGFSSRVSDETGGCAATDGWAYTCDDSGGGGGSAVCHKQHMETGHESRQLSRCTRSLSSNPERRQLTQWPRSCNNISRPLDPLRHKRKKKQI